MRRRSFWTTSLCFVSLFLVLLCVGYWWNGWPQRTREKVVSLLRAEKIGVLQSIFEDSDWKMHSDGSATLTAGEESVRLKTTRWVEVFDSLEVESRSFSARLEARMVGEVDLGSGLGGFEMRGRAAVQKNYSMRLVFERGKVLVATTAELRPTAWTVTY